MSTRIWIFLLFFILFSIIFSILLRYYNQTDFIQPPNLTLQKQKNHLYNNGVCVIHDFISNDDIQMMKKNIGNNEIQKAKLHIIQSAAIQSKIKQLLGDDYEFHDYIFLIKKSQFHTCHRDYNGDFFNDGQQYPSYTIILYLENMQKCLDVIPTSHKSNREYNYNFTDHTQTISCKNGDAILFNANLIHNGSLNENENSMRIQMKISHKKDRHVLQFYNNYNKMLNTENNTPHIFKQIQKHVSCQFPIISYYAKQYDHNKETNSKNTGLFTNLFAKLDNV